MKEIEHRPVWALVFGLATERQGGDDLCVSGIEGNSSMSGEVDREATMSNVLCAALISSGKRLEKVPIYSLDTLEGLELRDELSDRLAI